MFLRMVVANSYFLSGLYLCVGIVTELLRLYWPRHEVLRFAFALDSLPARALEELGVLGTVRDWYVLGQLNGFAVRMIFGLTTVTVIFVLALVIGGAMWSLQSLRTRSTRHPR